MLNKSVAMVCLLTVVPACVAGEINLYSINTGSFVYHTINNEGQYTENFDNKFFSVERKFSEDSKYSILGRDADLVVVVDCQIRTDDLIVHLF